MGLKLKHNADSILEHEFQAVKNGYDPFDVDSFLDEIVTDYVATQQFLLKNDKLIENLQRENTDLKNSVEKLEIENALYKSKFKSVAENDNVSLANIDLLKRISALENALYKLGKDPNEIK